MAANWAVGEIGVNWEGRDIVFRPSLFAVSRLGSPTEILEMFVTLMVEGWDGPRPLVRTRAREQFRIALAVLSACAPDDADLDGLLGCYSERMRYRPGAMPFDNIVALARHLITHGVAGVSPGRDEPVLKGEPMQEFDAGKFASMAIAHLGATQADAWQYTMTGLIAALNAKFPPDKSSAASITEKQYTESMDWLKRVNAVRDGGKQA